MTCYEPPPASASPCHCGASSSSREHSATRDRGRWSGCSTHDERGLDLLLLHHAVASAEPWDGTRDARVDAGARTALVR